VDLDSEPTSSPASIVELSVAKQSIVQQLEREVRQLEHSGRSATSAPLISTGCEALDACLPQRGYTPGSVVEYLRATPACGASYLAYAAAASAMKTSGGYLVIVDIQHQVYPPALVPHGIDLERVILVRPGSHADAIWAVDQALRTPAVAAVVADLEKIEDRTARRFQLAAENGDGLALLLRSAAARHRPSWAEVQWLVRSPVATPVAGLLSPGSLAAAKIGGRYVQVKLIRNRGGSPGALVSLEIDGISGALKSAQRERSRHEQQGAMHLATELAHPKSPSRRAAVG
jgi:protein ImuA